MVLADLGTSESGIIVKVNGQGSFRKRIMEMGFIRGQVITVIKNAPLMDPVEYSLMGYKVSLRRSEALKIEVVTTVETVGKIEFNSPLQTSGLSKKNTHNGKEINIGLIGNPNSGKTSIFNFASNSKEHVANYGGVTVDTKLAHFEYMGYIFNIVDLPGTYSLSSYSPEEIFVRNFIYDDQPDVIINVVDSTNLERNLYLTTQLIDLNVKLVIALNMYDELTSRGDRFDYVSFSRMTGIPVVPTVGSKGKGLAQLFNSIIARFKEDNENTRHININYGIDVEKSINKLQQTIRKFDNNILNKRYCSRFIAIKLLERDIEITESLLDSPESSEIITLAQKETSQLESLNNDDSSTIITNARFGFINGLLKETYTVHFSKKKKRSERIDKILTHKLLGLPFFLFFLWVIFQSTFSLGKYPMDWINQLVNSFSYFINLNMPSGDLKNLITQGIIGGIGGVIVFLPNILILFFFIALLEDTGYMARAAFLVDKVMHKIGLHGKSFIPLIMGFGCNVPAILSTRIIESRNNRIITMLIVPFMSCSARLPVYILIIGTFFPTYQGTVLFGLYILGILLASITAILLRRFHFKQEDVPFVMELPPYRVPTFKNTIRHMMDKAGQYLQKIGGVILIASVIIWGLGYYPKNNSNDLKSESGISQQISLPLNNSDPDDAQFRNESYLERLGKTIEPVIKPLGFDWKMGVSIIAGVAGKEIVVSTMGVMFQEDVTGKTSSSLGEKIRNYKNSEGKPAYNPIAAMSFLLFILIYFPCLAVIITIAKESGSRWWSLFLMVYTTGLAWLISFIFYQTGNYFIN